MTKSVIKFGTDGWRGKIAEDFTFDNLRLATQALVDYLKQQGVANKGVAVSYDNRFRSEHFAQAAAEVCSGAGLKVFLTKRSVPTPVLSYTVKNLDLAAGIMITASHNPPTWNGFKVKEAVGSSAFPETTRGVEAALKDTLLIVPSEKNIEVIDPQPAYFEKIKSLVNLELIKNSRLKPVVDAMHGSGAGYFSALGLEVNEIRGQRDTLFGGVNPEPIPVNLTESLKVVKKYAGKNSGHLVACIVLDGDADRLAAIDGSGAFINTHNVFCLLLHHLAVNRHLSGNVVKTFNLSNLIDLLCAKYQRKLYVTPIGFKYIADLMLKEDIVMGGEESGGMGLKGFIPERDGILAGLTLLELMATEKKTLKQILDGLMVEYGRFYYNRLDIHTTKAQMLVSSLKSQPPPEFAGKKVAKVETLDGFKLDFSDQAWILLRASGTEPLLRIYAEGRSLEDVQRMLDAGKALTR
ncbi:phosphoglucomutase/phosphomannomutase family protein [Candidatus Saganbacteria bacterium]|nr:phosphoglucomutase/phosphomannomutase family protein [Candidatus Saganbacteria bacterium]